MKKPNEKTVENRRFRLKQWIELYYNGLQSSFIEKTGVNQGELSALLKNKSFGENKARTLEKQAGMPEFYLDKTEDNSLLPPQTKSNPLWLGSLDIYDNNSPIMDDEVELPFFREVELAGGSGVCEVRENYIVKIRFPKSELKKRNILPAHAACVRVSGNSMEPAYPHGSIVGIDTNSTEIKDGEHYAIDHNGYLRVKIIYKLPNGGLRLRSFNREEWPDENLSKDEPIKIIGRVFWSSGFR